MPILTSLLLQLAISAVCLQDNESRYSKFIPQNHKIILVSKGDLNNDQLEDMILVTSNDHLAHTERDSLEPVRSLLLLVSNAPHEFTLAARNDKAIMCKQCGGAFGDPLSGIGATKNGFYIYHYGGAGWRWSIGHFFEWHANDRQWYLVKTEHSGHHIYDPEQADTGEVLLPDTLISIERFVTEE